MSFEIVLIHANGERKTMLVEYVSPSLRYVSIRWGIAGMYDLNLNTNVLSGSGEMQNKGKAKWYKKEAVLWKAEDIVAVRMMANNYLKQRSGARPVTKVNSKPMTNPRIGSGN